MTRVVVTIACLLTAACTLNEGTAPSVTGPSEFALSVAMSAIPEQLPRDGASQSAITLTVRDGSGRPVPNQRLSVSTNVGSVNASEVTTSSDGRASLVLTAPIAGTVGNAAVLQVVAIGNGSASVPRTFSIPLSGASNTVAPSPDFTPSTTSPEMRQLVVFDASKSTDEGVPCNDNCTYLWTFGDGSVARGRIVSHAFSTPGTYVVTLAVTDAAGAIRTTSQSLTVKNVAAPDVKITVSPAIPIAGQQATFIATATTPTGHSVQSYAWDFGDGTTQTTTAPSATKTYSRVGTYTASVTATDDLGQQGTATVPLTVGSGIIFPSPSFSISPTNPRPAQTVNFNASGITSAGGATITAYEWDFGDGSAAVTSSSPSAQHAYATEQTFVARLTVTDSQGRTATTTQNVPVKQPE